MSKGPFTANKPLGEKFDADRLCDAVAVWAASSFPLPDRLEDNGAFERLKERFAPYTVADLKNPPQTFMGIRVIANPALPTNAIEFVTVDAFGRETRQRFIIEEPQT